MSWVDRNLWQEFKRRADDERVWQAQRDRRRDKEREESKEERSEATTNDLLSAVEQVAELREISERLDALEVQVTQSLLENDQKLDAVREKLHAMLAAAVVLPDGRRVFKTEDGTQVFDEHGEEVSPDVIDPDSIDDNLATWEDFQAELDREADLLVEREQLLDLQQDIDAARDAAEKGELDVSELDALEAEFGELEKPSNASAQTVETTSPTAEHTEIAVKDTATKFQF